MRLLLGVEQEKKATAQLETELDEEKLNRLLVRAPSFGITEPSWYHKKLAWSCEVVLDLALVRDLRFVVGFQLSPTKKVAR